MKRIIAQIRTDFATGGQSLDGLLISARVLLYVLLVALIVAVIVNIIGVVTVFATNAGAFFTLQASAPWPSVGRSLLTLIALGMAQSIILQLLAVIGTVECRDSFALDNIRRLERIAANLLGLQILGLLSRLAGLEIGGDINGIDLGVTLTPGGVAVVLLLFILARVFRQGAAMRDDLEGTV